MKPNDVERVIRRAAHHLAEALDQYWPTNGNNEVGERNITLALTRAFSEAGFSLYAESHSGDGTETRLDLLAINFEKETQVAVEAKRLYGAQQASSMLADLHRVRDFQLSRTGLYGRPPPVKRFGLVIATTWNEAYARWFSHAEADDPSGDAWGKLIDPNHTGIPPANMTWGSVVLRRQYNSRPEDDRHHFLVYCLIALDGVSHEATARAP